MPDPVRGYSADEIAEIKQGILALGGVSVAHLTEGFAAIADAGISTADIEAAAQQWPSLVAGVQPTVTDREDKT
jgi:hypothetical protein